MSGFGGIWHKLGGSVLPETLTRISAALVERGADASGTWSDGPVAIASRLFRTTVESVNEHQPLASADGCQVVAADARIDNRAEIAPLLGLPVTAPDSQIILEAYRAWAEGCALRLIGDFAFVIWDAPKQQFFCARDSFGVRPMYYFASRELFVFGSSIRSVTVVQEVPSQLNQEKIVDYMTEMFDDKERTFYQDVLRLPPAHWMIVNRDSVRKVRYWQPDINRELRLPTEDEYAEAYREAFVEAVRCRMNSTVRVGSMLSGGIDSSSVACVAQRLLDGPALPTFSIVFDSVPKSDERQWIQAVLDEGRYEAHFVAGDQVNPVTDMLQATPSLDEPVYAPEIFLNRAAWQRVRQSGVGVLMEGLLGDNVVSHGNILMNEMARGWRWLSVYRYYQELAAASNGTRSFWEYLPGTLWEDGIKGRVPESMFRVWRRLRGTDPGGPAMMPDFFQTEFARRMGVKERSQRSFQAHRRLVSSKASHYHDLEYGLVPVGLEVYSAEGARIGLEPRLPFTDRRLVELCLAIPPEYKLRHGYSRWVARAGLRQYLPEKIRTRPDKGNLGWNFMRGMRADREVLARIFDRVDPALEEIFYLPRLRKLANRVPDSSWNDNNVLYVFLAAGLVAWMNEGGVCKSDRKKEVIVEQPDQSS